MNIVLHVLISPYFAMMLISMIIVGNLVIKKRNSLNMTVMIVMPAMLLVEAAGLLLHIYLKGTYDFDAWNIISAAYHYGKPYSSPDFYYAFLKAFNTHGGLAFAYPDSEFKLFLIFTKATSVWETAARLDILAAAAFYVSLLFYRPLTKYRKFILPLILLVPAAIAVWQISCLAGYSGLFIRYSLSLCLAGYMLDAFPFTYYALSKQPKL
jgi:hypothetical protein